MSTVSYIQVSLHQTNAASTGSESSGTRKRPPQRPHTPACRSNVIEMATGMAAATNRVPIASVEKTNAPKSQASLFRRKARTAAKQLQTISTTNATSVMNVNCRIKKIGLSAKTPAPSKAWRRSTSSSRSNK